MKRLITLATLFICWSFNIFSQTDESNFKKLTFLNKTVNFGDVVSDTTLTAKFFFVNNGYKPVKIEYVNPDCTCTDYFLSKNIVNVMDTAYVELRVNTQHKYGYNKIYSTMKADTFVKMYKLTIIFNLID